MTKSLENVNEGEFLYLELHHRVLAEFVSAGGSDLIQADDLGLVADAISLKAPDESCFAAILPCGCTHTDTQTNVDSVLRYIFQSRTSIYCRLVLLSQDHQSHTTQEFLCNLKNIVQVNADTDFNKMFL